MKRNWWKESVIYQIYPRSFKDSNGDGIGDLRGIIEKTDYLKDLGVDILWLSPIYQSPNDDNGYDISDYYQIMTEFGTMADFDELLAELHKREIKLVMDLVVNHSSDEHEWFQKSKTSKDNPYRDYYIWRKGKNGGPPNNWKSFFGGSVWEYDEETEEYYLHLFTRKQPDLNWENEKLRQEIYAMMRFWLDKGVDGFRMDVIPLLSKRLEFADGDMSDFGKAVEKIYANGPRIHEFLQEMHREVLGKYDVVSIGEGVGVPPETAELYVGDYRKEINMIYHFGHMFIDHGEKGRMDPKNWTRSGFVDVFKSWDRALKANSWGTIYLGNHDFPRLVSRFGDAENYWYESATLLATLICILRGTPTLYQGDEIGMRNVSFKQASQFRDVEFFNTYKEQKAIQGDKFDENKFIEIACEFGRDNARTPMQWDSSVNAGFSKVQPWIDVNSNFSEINVANQENSPVSILSFYKKLLKFRKEDLIWVYGEQEIFELIENQLYAVARIQGSVVKWVILNFSNSEFEIDLWLADDSEIQFSNYQSANENKHLGPWQVSIFAMSLESYISLKNSILN